MTDSTALTRVRGSTDLALPEDLIEQARSYAINSRAERTKHEYDRCWRQFCDWCQKMGATPLPVSVQTLVAYVTDLAKTGGPKGKPLSKSSIDQAMAALKLRHSMAGAPTEPFASPVLKEVRKGINREISSKRSIRRVKPLLETDLRDLLDTLRPNVLREARDAAILALGFGAARRRSELVGLDYGQLGDGTGILTIDDKGVRLQLMRSKTNQEGAEEEYIIPRMAAPRICSVIENWITLAGITKGTAVFRSIDGTGYSKKPQSGFIGVTWKEHASGKGVWQAHVKQAGKLRFLGHYDDPEVAHKAICAETGAAPSKPFEGRVSPRRITSDAIAKLVKARIGDLVRAQAGRRKVKPEEIAQAVADYSGHSLRSGHVTSAADRGVPVHHIQAATGHKSQAMIGVYSRVSDKIKNSSLKGSGL